MSNEQLDLVRGSGNAFRDFGVAEADAEQLRSILAAQIIKLLDAKGLTVREAERMTGVAAGDFSRIRRAHLGRFTIDRLMTILNRLNYRVEVTVTVWAMAQGRDPGKEPDLVGAATVIFTTEAQRHTEGHGEEERLTAPPFSSVSLCAPSAPLW